MSDKTINIKLIKFSNGEEIIANVLNHNTHNAVIFEDAMRVIIIPPTGENQKPTIAFAAFIPYAEDKEMEVDARNILLIVTPIKEIIEQWKEVFGQRSSIWLPQKQNALINSVANDQIV